MTLWELLGVPRGCPNEDLTKAYRKKCLELHPDKTGNDPQKTKLFVSMKTVYESVIKRRQVYGIEKPLSQESAPVGTAASQTSTTTNWKTSFFSSQDLYGIWEQMVKEGIVSPRQGFDEFQKKRNMAGDILKGKKNTS